MKVECRCHMTPPNDNPEHHQHTAACHRHPHPNYHHTGSQWSADQTLHVAVAYTNPKQYQSRRKLFSNFRQSMSRTPNVVLHVAEATYGDLPFEATDANHPTDYQYKAKSVLWLKENLLNLAVQQFPKDWQYGAYIDGDVTFTRYDWALETIHQLQHYDWMQLFTHYTNLGPNNEILSTSPSCVKRHLDNLGAPRNYTRGATGLAWAFTRQSFDAVGGFMDKCILGSGDWHMALGLIGEPDRTPEVTELEGDAARYSEYIRIWQDRAGKAVRGNVGVLENYAVHHFHGPKDLRHYGERRKILQVNGYNPYVDVFQDWQGLYQLTPDKPRLRDGIRRYFSARSEDDLRTSIPAADKKPLKII